jgi:monoamine oxidase
MASEKTPGRSISRRQLLASAAAVGAATLAERRSLSSAFADPRPPAGAGQPRIAIVGAGLAGLTCAYRLHERGLASTVYEAHASRVGGRCWTAREFAAGQTAEHGGEFIDSDHHRIRTLAKELGLTLVDVKRIARRHRGLRSRIFLDGKLRGGKEVYRDEPVIERRAAADYRRVRQFDWRRATRAARELDEMTAREWLNEALPDPGQRLLRLVTEQFMSEEYGLDCDRLSAIAMLVEYGPAGAVSDERFHVRGGNDQIASGLRRRLPVGTVQPDHPLSSLRRSGSAYALGFEGQKQAVADVVVLCLPFTALRRVDLSAAGLGQRKRSCIEELGMGTNAKLLLQFRDRLGDYDRFDGEYTDGHIDTWDSSLGERGSSGLLTVYSGGRQGAGYGVASPHAPAPAAIARAAAATVSRAVPGLAAGYNGISWLDHWASDPWTHGSYAAFMPGQFTRYWGFAGIAEGGVHFGGEHTALAAQGFLEGAVQSGERCAREVALRAGAH